MLSTTRVFPIFFDFTSSVIGEQCMVLSKFHVEIWDGDFEDSITELANKAPHIGDEVHGAISQNIKPYFISLQDIKIKCETYVEYLPPELFFYILGCHSNLTIVQVKCFNYIIINGKMV